MGKGDEKPPSPLRRRRDRSPARGHARARTSLPAAPSSPPSPLTSRGSPSSTTNEQEQAVQQQIFLQNGNLVNFIEAMAMKNEQIARLRLQIQKTKEATTQLMDLATKRCEMNRMLISQLPAVQGTNGHGHGLTDELESTGSCNQAMNMEGTAAESKYLTTLACEVCCSGLACMLILPCRHLCACKSCGPNLTVCPVCGSAKANMIEAKFE